MNIEEAAASLSALGQETRLSICMLLARADTDGMPAGEIGLALGIAQNTLSFHLSGMEKEELVRSRRQGRYVIYSLNDKAIDRLILYLAEKCRRKE